GSVQIPVTALTLIEADRECDVVCGEHHPVVPCPYDTRRSRRGFRINDQRTRQERVERFRRNRRYCGRQGLGVHPRLQLADLQLVAIPAREASVWNALEAQTRGCA